MYRCASEERKLPVDLWSDATIPLMGGKSLPLSETDDIDSNASGEHLYWSGTRSLDLSSNAKSGQSLLLPENRLSTTAATGFTFFTLFENVNITMTAFRIFSILERELKAMVARPNMIVASLLLQLLIAGMSC